MKIMTRPVLALTALWCMAVFLVPYALAADQGPGNMQMPGSSGSGPNNQGDRGMMQAPPAGGQEGFTGQDGPGGQGSSGNGNNGQFSAPPSGGTGNASQTTPPGRGSIRDNGNMTSRDFGNMTFRQAPDGIPGEGNMTRNTFGNLTAGNMTGFRGPGMHGDGNLTPGDYGNMTPPDFGNQTARNMTWSDRPGISGNGTQMHYGFGNQTAANATQPGNGMQGGQNDRGMNTQPGSGEASRASQQSSGDVIGELINRIAAFFSSKK